MCLQKAVGTYKLTEKGRAHVKLAMPIGQPERVIMSRDVAPQHMNAFELMQLLASGGWSSREVELTDVKKVRHNPISPKSPDGIWFVRVGQRTVQRMYLLALATISEHLRPVPHFAENKVCS